jgi:hypothetical protein
MDKYIKKLLCEVCQIPIGEEWERDNGERYVMRYINFAPYERPICARCQNDEFIRKQQQGHYRKFR